ncbi:MAG TPA: ABC transporter ATP-binding protein [Myxococcota bacterium]|nr:ABC transporter ATP-binding protein [Myxococcota bacterium]
MAELLKLDRVTKRFGGLTAVSDVSFALEEGEVVGLIGPNGAGKTTVFNLITGVYQPSSGRIAVMGQPTAKKTPDRITALGVARTFQNIRLFREMSALDNVKVGFTLKNRYGLFASFLHTRAWREEERETERQAMQLLETMGLADLAHEQAGGLAYGPQRRLEIARALATSPRLLILDEPAAGMNPQEKDELAKMVVDIKRRFGLTLLVIEHDMKFVMGLCERIIVLDYGRVIARGTPDEIRRDPAVIAAYLGAELSETMAGSGAVADGEGVSAAAVTPTGTAGGAP